MAAGVLSGLENRPPCEGRVGSSPTLTARRERGDDGESHRSVKSGRFGALGVRIPPLPSMVGVAYAVKHQSVALEKRVQVPSPTPVPPLTTAGYPPKVGVVSSERGGSPGP